MSHENATLLFSKLNHRISVYFVASNDSLFLGDWIFMVTLAPAHISAEDFGQGRGGGFSHMGEAPNKFC